MIGIIEGMKIKIIDIKSFETRLEFWLLQA